MADEDMPPPLEDMSATLEQARKLRGARSRTQGHCTSDANRPQAMKQDTAQARGQHHSTQNSKTCGQQLPSTASPATTPNHTQSTKEPSDSNKSQSARPKSQNTGAGAEDFGGMKKGFLFGGPKAGSSSSSQKTKTDNVKSDADRQANSIPLIKPKMQEKDSGLKLDEVQQAMESTKGFLQDKDWVTEDLLEKVQKNETLSKRLGDPRFMQAVTEFQTNPKAAMEKYQNNPEMQLFLKEFCGILGEHFSCLGDGQDNQNRGQEATAMRGSPKITELTDGDVSPSAGSQRSSVPVDPHVEQILSDPANQEILMDPKIQQLIQNLRNNPEKAQRMLREGDSAFKHKVDRLISLGLLKFQA